MRVRGQSRQREGHRRQPRTGRANGCPLVALRVPCQRWRLAPRPTDRSCRPSDNGVGVRHRLHVGHRRSPGGRCGSARRCAVHARGSLLLSRRHLGRDLSPGRHCFQHPGSKDWAFARPVEGPSDVGVGREHRSQVGGEHGCVTRQHDRARDDIGQSSVDDVVALVDQEQSTLWCVHSFARDRWPIFSVTVRTDSGRAWA